MRAQEGNSYLFLLSKMYLVQILFKKPLACKRGQDFWEKDDENDKIVDKKTSYSRRTVVAAIEFGTTLSGYAFSFRDTCKWTDPYFESFDKRYHKVATSLLLNPDQSFCKFGFAAEEEYALLVEEDKHRDYFFFRRFMSILKPNNTGLKVCDNYNVFLHTTSIQ